MRKCGEGREGGRKERKLGGRLRWCEDEGEEEGVLVEGKDERKGKN